MRGRKLVLNYTDGSPCGSEESKRSVDLTDREIVEDPEKGDGDKNKGDGDKNKGDEDKKPASKGRRKSTIISMLCDRDPLAPQLSLNFVGSMDECSYFFEGRSAAACATLNTTKGSLNPGGVFGVIVIIALLVYLVGGCVYNRTVLQQRGWSQVPNYHLWAGILGFFKVRSRPERSQFLD
jgi:cation-dependent mannose-6-phosphate receptor